MRNKINFLSLIIIALILSSCGSVYYAPNAQNVPLFTEKNDFKASKSLYVEVFTDLKKKTTDSREWISQIEKDLIFKLIKVIQN